MFSNCEALAIRREWLPLEPEPIFRYEDEDDEAIRIMAAINECVSEPGDKDESVVAGELCVPTESRLAERFREQSDKWAQETRHLSSPIQRMGHPSYQAIMGMAQENKREVIRLLILDLQQRRRPWFWALSYLAQTNPVSRKDAGKMDRMIEAWVKWAKAEGVI
jgi:hypothetical protein